MTILFSLVYCSLLEAQEYRFVGVNKELKVVNVDVLDDTNILVRTSKELYKFDGEIFSQIDLSPLLRYSWTRFDPELGENKIYHTKYIPDFKEIQEEEIPYILPGNYSPVISHARVGNTIYVAYNGMILSYSIAEMYDHIYQGISVRHIFANDSLRIYSTYEGIFYNEGPYIYTTVPMAGAGYSNGELNHVFGRFLLSADDLVEIEAKDVLKYVRYTKNEPKYRSITQVDSIAYVLFDSKIDVVDQELNTLNTLIEGMDFSDLLIEESLLYASTFSGRLFILNGQSNTVTREAQNDPTNDISYFNDTLFLSTSRGILLLNPQLEKLKYIFHDDVLQSVKIGKYLIFSANDGLYVYDLVNEAKFTLVNDIEFNRKALIIWDNEVYAGAVDGLYFLHWSEIESNLLNRKHSIIEESRFGKSSFILFFITLIILSFIGFLVFRRFSGDKFLKAKRPVDISIDSLKELIINDPTVVSISDLSDKVSISQVHLNRLVKTFGTTPGQILRDTKQQIAIEMWKDGVSLEKISKRVGYSSRYVRENFIKSQ